MCVYIAMEYLPVGDLQRHKEDLPPFPEPDASKIVRQLIQGVQFMHDNGFAHRDLKPGNILISSAAPLWQVKITDFGISKRALQGVTRLRTMNGTWGYQAPEVLGLHPSGDASLDSQAIGYTMSVDIWAVGIIALELLVKREIFSLPGNLADFVYGRRPLDLSREGEELTDECRQFVTSLLEPEPALRPTATATLAHPWLRQAIHPSPEDPDTEMPRQEEGQSHLHGPSTPGPVTGSPSGRDTKPRAGKATGSKHKANPRSITDFLEKFQNLYLDSVLLMPKFRKLQFDTVCCPRSLRQARPLIVLCPIGTQTRYFVLRSDNQTDVETSAALGTWTSSERVNKILNKGYLESGGRVVLFFSVILRYAT